MTASDTVKHQWISRHNIVIGIKVLLRGNALKSVRLQFWSILVHQHWIWRANHYWGTAQYSRKSAKKRSTQKERFHKKTWHWTVVSSTRENANTSMKCTSLKRRYNSQYSSERWSCRRFPLSMSIPLIMKITQSLPLSEKYKRKGKKEVHQQKSQELCIF